jgi:hypothetical protein
MPNVEEIKQIVKIIETTPMKPYWEVEPGSPVWDQGNWVGGPRRLLKPSEQAQQQGWYRDAAVVDASCATTCCMAGFAIIRAGYAYGSGNVWNPETGDYIGPILEVAAELLGLDHVQAMDIFSGDIGTDRVTQKGKAIQLKATITKATGITFDD